MRAAKNCVAWKVEKAVHYVVHEDSVTTVSSVDYGKEPQPLEGCLIWDVAQSLDKLHQKSLNTFQRLTIPGENAGGCLYACSKCGRSNTWLFGSTDNVIVGTESGIQEKS